MIPGKFFAGCFPNACRSPMAKESDPKRRLSGYPIAVE